MTQKHYESESSELKRLREKRDEAEREYQQAVHRLQRVENRTKYLEKGERSKRTHRLPRRRKTLQ